MNDDDGNNRPGLSPEDLAAARACGASAPRLPIEKAAEVARILDPAWREAVKESKAAAEAERKAPKTKGAKRSRVTRDRRKSPPSQNGDQHRP